MPAKAMILASDSLNPSAYGPNDRPDVFITPAGRIALIPDVDEMLSRRGAKGLQTSLDDLSHHHFMKHGYDWIYAGGRIETRHGLYFIHFGGTVAAPDVHYLGKIRQAIDFLLSYALLGTPNHSIRRAR